MSGARRARRTSGAWPLLLLVGLGSVAARGAHGEAGGSAPARTARTDPDQPTISWTWNTIRPQPGEPRGKVIFERDCVICHGSGPAKPGTRALRAKYHGKEPALLSERRDLAPDYVREIVRHGLSVMPPFRKTELSNTDLDALIAYLTRENRP